MENILNVILTNTYTLTQLKRRVKVLKNYLISQLFTDQKDQKTQVFFKNEDLAWLRSLQTPFYQQFNESNLYAIFVDLEKRISEFPFLYIYLPFETDDGTTAQIGQFIQKTYGKLILFEVKYDPALIAGCALSWQGIYRDYSLRKKVEDRKSEIILSFKKFLR